MDENLNVQNACYDEPRDTDRIREQVFGNEVAEGSPEFVKRPEGTIVYNQNSDPKTLKGCVGYATYHIFNAQQMNERKNNGIVFTQEDPKYYRLRFQQNRGWPNRGSSIQEHIDFMRKVEKSIEGSVRCETEEQMKMALDMGKFILTGSTRCDRTKTGKTGIFTLVDVGPQHGIMIGGYDSQGFIAKNSFGEGWGNKGYFHIPFGYKKYLYSCNAIIDSDSTGKMQSYKYEQDFQNAIKEGITNGTDPDRPASRKEVAVMVYRGLKKALQK